MASRGVSAAWGVPASETSPLSARCTPLSTLMTVLLPDPFSPARQRTSPGAIPNDTRSSACTPPNRLDTARSARTGESVRNYTGSCFSLVTPTQPAPYSSPGRAGSGASRLW